MSRGRQVTVTGCAGKRKYATAELAAAINANIRERHRKAAKTHPYLCQGCGCWHSSKLTAEENQAVLARADARKRKWASSMSRRWKT